MLFADDMTKNQGNANDNVGGLTSVEREEMLNEVGTYFGHILRAMRVDVDNDPNSKDTPRRVAKMFVDELFVGRFTPPPSLTVFPNVKAIDQLIVVGPLTVKSLCSHHFMPIVGTAWIGYLPDKSLIGLSKFPRVVEWFSRRPQIQEELTEQICRYLDDTLRPKGIGVYVRARHFCMSHRGVNEDVNAFMDTTSLRGAILEHDSLKSEFLASISRG